MAQPLGCDPNLLSDAGRLHDVGMASAASLGAHVPGPLTDDQRHAMRAHTVVGHAMLGCATSSVLKLGAEIALTHHERWDGSGYPNAISGLAIPLPGRIMAVADTFDAITTDRPYRRAAPIAHAAVVLEAERDRQFDPRVVDAFLDVLDHAESILASHPPLEAGASAVRSLTLTAAAAALDVTPSRLRRWADEGRIDSVRTRGGHRRFPTHEVQRLASELGVAPEVRRVVLPRTRLPRVATALRHHGRQLAAVTADSLYVGRGPAGWFASDASGIALDAWIDRTADACNRGDYAGVHEAVVQFMLVAESFAATLLERHAFLEGFAQAVTRVLADRGAPREEIAGARRLFVALQHAALDAAGHRP